MYSLKRFVDSSKKQKFNPAFTIVELLVVIVVIGILAAISIVSYSGIAQRATAARLQSDLNSNSKLLELYKVEHDEYPRSLDANNCPDSPTVDNKYCLKVSEDDDTLTYEGDGGTGGGAGDSYTLTITDDDSNISYEIVPGGAAVAVEPSAPVVVTNITFASAWGGAGSEYGSYIVQTSDGGYAITGGTNDGAGDMFIAKYDSDGVQTWNKTWGGAGDDGGSGIIQTGDGGYVVSGYTKSFGAGQNDAFIAKFDSNGNLTWNKTWGGAGVDNGYSVIQSNDGGYILSGITFTYGSGNADIFFARYDTSGNLTWNKTWGGTSGELGGSIIPTSDGGYAITGQTMSFGAGGFDMFIAKFDSSGNLSWNKTWGGTIEEDGNSIVQTGDGGYLVAGRSSSFGGGYNAYVVKFDTSGSLLWNKTWGGANTDGAYSVANTNDDGFVIFGTTRTYGAGDYDAFVAKYDSSGTLSWSRTFGGTEFDSVISGLQTTDDGYVAVGKASSYVAAESYNDLLVIKFDVDGNMPGCESPMCKSISAATGNPSATVSTPSATVSAPSAGGSSPSATMSTVVLTSTLIVTPPVPPPAMTVTFSADELKVLYPGDDQTLCKEWTVPGGNTIKGFIVNQETESGYDFFTVSSDGVERYNESGYKANMYVDISATPGTTLSACMIADSSVQDGFGGEVTGVLYN
jgi:prepilin-type N-terminal cleavage/methylation domain-containing protein